MIDPIIIFAFIEVESSGKPGAFLMDRNGGSFGWMQIDLATAKDRGYTGDGPGLYALSTNVEYGAKILQWLTDSLTAHRVYSLSNLAAAYNSGLGHVLGGGTDAGYSAKIVAAYAKWNAAAGGLLMRGQS